MSKFLTALYPILSVALMILPASAGTAPLCQMAHSDSLVSEAYAEDMLREDEAASQLGPVDFSRRPYPPHYYEKYHHRMSLRHKLYAYYQLYLPQFFNVRSSSPRRLLGSFLVWDFQKPTPFLFDQDLERLSDSHFYPVEMVWRGHQEDPILPESLVPAAFVRHWTFLPMRLPSILPTFLRTNATKVRRLIEDSLARIYESFASQGPERQILVPIVKEQDQRDLERTTHFEYGILNIEASAEKNMIQIDEVAHMQIITSTGADQSFHFEEQWGKMDRIPGEVWGEAGRFILKPWEHLNPESQKNVPKSELKSIKFRLLHKGFAWANNDARLDRLFLQVNDRVRGVLIDMGWPLEKAQATKKVQDIDGKPTQEWLFNLDKHMMTEIEKRMLKNLMLVYFQKFIQNPSSHWLEMSFDPNEIKTLIKLGLIRASNDNPTAFTDAIKNRSWPTLQPTDPSAAPIFTIRPDHLEKVDRLSLHFSSAMIRKLMAEWMLKSNE